MPDITNNNVTIHYKTHGDKSNPALVMLHGFGNNSQNWYDLGYVDILSRHLYLIMLDIRGFGLSDKPLEKNAYLLENIASDVLAVLDNENVSQAHLYGSSVGAIEAGFLATHFQDRFHSFIFQGTSPYNVHLIKALLQDILLRTKDKGIVAYVDELENFVGQKFPGYIRNAMELCEPEALYAASLAVWPDQVDKFPGISKPCLIIIGEQEGVTDDMQKAASIIPDCELEIIPGFDHADAYWGGSTVAPLIIKFISKKIK